MTIEEEKSKKKSDLSIISYENKDLITFYKNETGKSAYWGGNLSKTYKDWANKNYKRIKETLSKETEKIKDLNIKIKQILLDLKYNYDNKGVTISHKKHHITYITWANKQHFKINSPRSELYKYLNNNIPEFKDIHYRDVLIQILKDRFEAKRLEIRGEIKGKHKTEKVEPDESINTLDKLLNIINKNLYNREKDFMILLCVIISHFFHKSDYIFLCIVASEGSGKSLLCKCFPNSDYNVAVAETTLESWAPGTAREEDVTHALLDEVRDKTVINEDMSMTLSSSQNKIDKFFGTIELIYGDSLPKHSPGTGLQEYDCRINYIFGLRIVTYIDHIKRFGSTQKILIYKLTRSDHTKAIREDDFEDPDKELIKKSVLGFMINLHKRREEMIKKELDIEIPKLIRLYISDFVEVLVNYGLVWKEEKKYKYHAFDPRGTGRPYNQMIMLCKAKCFMEERTSITKEDVDFFKPLFWKLDDIDDRCDKLYAIKKNISLITPFINKYKVFDTKVDQKRDKEDRKNKKRGVKLPKKNKKDKKKIDEYEIPDYYEKDEYENELEF